MTDLDLLTGTIAARIRTLPDVERLYPPQKRLLGIPVTGTGVLTALAADDTVAAHLDGDLLQIEVTLAIDGGTSTAPAVAAAVAALVHTELDSAAIGSRRVTVRVASIEP